MIEDISYLILNSLNRILVGIYSVGVDYSVYTWFIAVAGMPYISPEYSN